MASPPPPRGPARSEALLKRIVMLEDRSRLSFAALAVVAAHTACSLLLRLPLSSAVAGLLGLLLLLVVQRALWVRLVPKMPSANEPSLSEIARSHGLVRGLGGLGAVVTAVVASLLYHDSGLLAPCSTDEELTACAPPSAVFRAVWAAALGLSIGLPNAAYGAQLPSRGGAWPLLAQTRFVRLRPLLPVALAQAARTCAQLAGGMLVAAWLTPSLLLRLGGLSLAVGGGCPPCGYGGVGDAVAGADGVGDEAGATAAASASMVPGVAQLLGLVARGVCFHLCASLALASVRIAYAHAPSPAHERLLSHSRAPPLSHA